MKSVVPFNLLADEPMDHVAVPECLAQLCPVKPTQAAAKPAAKPGAQSPAKPVPGKLTQDYIDQLMAQTKTCGGCNKWKPLVDFHEGKGKCNPCFNDRRSYFALQRLNTVESPSKTWSKMTISSSMPFATVLGRHVKQPRKVAPN